MGWSTVLLATTTTLQLVCLTSGAAWTKLLVLDPSSRGLKDVCLTLDKIRELHERFFMYYHSFMPFLNPNRTPDEFYKRSPLLFWTMLTIGSRHYSAEPPPVRCSTRPTQQAGMGNHGRCTSELPCRQGAHSVVRSGPLPTSSTSTDPTFMLCGLMMQIALQIGLHRPSHAQDFSKFRIELREVELQDRVIVWSVANIVAQRICTAYGQPPMTTYDWTLGPQANREQPKLRVASSNTEPIAHREVRG